LTEAAYRAKVEEYGCQLSAIEDKLKQFKDRDKDNVDNHNVDNLELNT
jgi:hypothetical protein